MAGLLRQGAGSDARFTLRRVGDMDLLYRVQDSREILVIPAVGGLRELLLAELHDSLMAGHFGVRRTLRALQARAWWP